MSDHIEDAGKVADKIANAIIKKQQAKLETMQKEKADIVNMYHEREMANLKRIAELEALTEADGKEIGSYRDGTGLRGENKALEARVAELEAYIQSAPRPVVDMSSDDVVLFLNDWMVWQDNAPTD